VARVLPEERAAFEAATRKDNAPEFSIRELKAGGEGTNSPHRTFKPE
jgi:hypothetical protein